MTQAEAHAEGAAKPWSPNLIPTEFVMMGKNRLENLAKIQTELIEKIQDANRGWLDRMQSEAALVSEFAIKLTAAPSFPETAAAYRELAGRHMEMAAEDAKRLLADSRKLMETGAHMLTTGWLSNGRSDV